MARWVESRDHRVNSRFRAVMIVVFVGIYALRLWGRSPDGIDLFFGGLLAVLAGVTALYGVSHVSLVDGGVVVRNGIRRRRLAAAEVADTTVVTLGTRRRPPSQRPDWRDAAAPSYLAFELVDETHVVAYGVALEPSLRVRSAGPDPFVATIDEVRGHLGLPPMGS